MQERALALGEVGAGGQGREDRLAEMNGMPWGGDEEDAVSRAHLGNSSRHKRWDGKS